MSRRQDTASLNLSVSLHRPALQPGGCGALQHRTTATRLRHRLLPALAALSAALSVTLPLAACGPTAEQVRARESASAAPSAPAVPSERPDSPSAPSPPAPSPTALPTAPAQEPSPARVGVSGSQAGMPESVQDACQFLLRREEAPLPAAEAGDCISAAMTAGGRGTQTLETESSWLPPGTHTVEFTTAPDFSLTLVNTDLKLRVTSGAAGGSVDTGTGRINADASGSPEEAYAAVLANAAELTVKPERVAELLAGMMPLEVDYGAVLNGAVRTRLSGVRPAETAAGTADTDAGDMTPTGLTVWLDDYYRPVRLEIAGKARGITSSITAVTTGWGAPL